MRVLVTGAAGYFGTIALAALAESPQVEAIVASDLRPPDFQHPKLRFVARDLVSDDLEPLFADVDTALHLAFVVERRPGQDPSRVNVAAARRFLELAAARVQTLVVMSSVMAYGLGEEPGGRLTEDAPVAPGRGFYYAEQKIALEAYLRELAGPARVVVVRPSVVGGPRMPAFRAAPYRGRFFLVPRTDAPRHVQMLHEDDLATALVTLLEAPAGVYNLAPDDALTTREVALLLGQRHLVLPMGVCAAVLDGAWRLGWSAIAGDWARTLQYPTHVVDNSRLRGLGWVPARTTADTLLALR